MKKQITITLDPKSVDEAIKELERYKAELKEKCTRLTQLLIEKGIENVEYIILNTSYLDTGELLSGLRRDAAAAISTTATGKIVGYISVSSDYAVYVEFGTGVIGSSSPHDLASELGYVYGKSENGWWYPTDEADPNPTKFEAEDGKLIAHTKGQPAKSFMYDTALYLRDIFFETAKEVFG